MATHQSWNQRTLKVRSSGFSLVELMVSLGVLTVVLAIVATGVANLAKMNVAQTDNVALTQESRQFVDQLVHDMHLAGFPATRLFATSTPASQSVGLVNLTSSSIQFEADVDGSGQVSEVFVQLTGNTCPCTISRGSVYKAAYLGGAMPAYYTVLNNVMTTTPFTAYDHGGNQIQMPCTQAGGCSDAATTPIANIKSISIRLPMLGNNASKADEASSTIEMSADAEINN